ncbi:MAG: hypothetical protein H6738_16035 [Alphaproteobacteria bacterium]|nr:hypothetical protein [Alphaproteobacteria bacterium]MCB9698289.1 hypothetical protein [Alphaproteobacteria bacterium]
MGFPDAVNPVVPGRLDRLKIAFAVQIAKRIAEADGMWDLGEVELLTRTFPTAMMQRAGFLDHRRELMPEAQTMYRQALSELPRVLTMGEKLELLALFHKTCSVDGEIHPRELDVLVESGAMLQVPHDQLLTHLRNLSGKATLIPSSHPPGEPNEGSGA